MTETPATTPEAEPELRRGRTPPIDPAEAGRLFREGVALFNGVRYWHAHEAWETVWRAAPDDERDFYQGLIQVAAGLLHLQRRNLRGARNKLAEGLDKLRRYEPAHQGVFVNELVGEARRLLHDLEGGHLPYLISPVIRFTEADQPDFGR
jgi:predicted metal-dependent hydrolase